MVPILGITQLVEQPCHGDWNIILRHEHNDLSFDKSWSEYAFGFGDPLLDFWIGNQVSLIRNNIL